MFTRARASYFEYPVTTGSEAVTGAARRHFNVKHDSN